MRSAQRCRLTYLIVGPVGFLYIANLDTSPFTERIEIERELRRFGTVRRAEGGNTRKQLATTTIKATTSEPFVETMHV